MRINQDDLEREVSRYGLMRVYWCAGPRGYLTDPLCYMKHRFRLRVTGQALSRT